MAEITVGGKTLTIPAPRIAECVSYIKKWYSLEGGTPQEILDVWSEYVIIEVKRHLISQIGNNAYNGSMEVAVDDVGAARQASETTAENEIEIV